MPKLKHQSDVCLRVRGFLVVCFEPLLNQFRLWWKYVKVSNHEQQIFSYKSKQIPTCSLLNPVVLALDVPVGWRNDSLSLCRFIQRLNQSMPAASLAIEKGLGILIWTANWKASLLISSRVHPKYFRSINKRYSTSFSSRAGGMIGLRPSFDWVAWKESQFDRK